MRAFITLKFDRPVDKDKHYIMPGGYEVSTKDRSYQFDFNDSYGYIDDEDKTIVHFELCNEDTDSFPDIEDLKKHLHEIIRIDECYVYTGEESEDEEINLVSVCEFIIEDSNPNGMKRRKNTDFILCKKLSEETMAYVFRKKLLNTIQI